MINLKISKVIIRTIGLTIVCFIMAIKVTGQELRNHLWENRVIVIQTKDEHSMQYRKQLEEFVNSVKELNERKLVLYQIVNQRIKYTDFKKSSHTSVWEELTEPDQFIMDKFENFRIELIGLDGGVKLKSNETVTKEELFKLIDSMPMRIYELKDNR